MSAIKAKEILHYYESVEEPFTSFFLFFFFVVKKIFFANSLENILKFKIQIFLYS